MSSFLWNSVFLFMDCRHFFVLLCVFGNGNVKVRRRSSLAVASELRGQGGTLYPQVQDLYPLYTPSQRCGLCQNFKQTTLTTRLYKVRTNLYLPPLTKTFRRASSLDWTIALGDQSRCAVAETLLDTTGRSNISARRRLRRLRDVSYTFFWYPKGLFVYGRRRMAAWAGLASAAPRPCSS